MKKIFIVFWVTFAWALPASAQKAPFSLVDILKAVQKFEQTEIHYYDASISSYNSSLPEKPVYFEEQPEYSQQTCLKLPTGSLYFKDIHDESKICPPDFEAVKNHLYLDPENGYLSAVNINGASNIYHELAVWPVDNRYPARLPDYLFVAYQGNSGLSFYLIKDSPEKIFRIPTDFIFSYLRVETFYPELASNPGSAKGLRLALPQKAGGDIIAYAIKGDEVVYQKMKKAKNTFSYSKQAPVTATIPADSII